MPESKTKGNFLSLLCVFALLASQALGGVTGYLCRCGGVETLTVTDHCHGPHSDACHDASDENDSVRSHEHDESSDGEREDHTPVGRSLELIKSAGVVAPELVPILVEMLTQPDFTVVLGRETPFKVLLRSLHSAQPVGVVVRQTVSLRV